MADDQNNRAPSDDSRNKRGKRGRGRGPGGEPGGDGRRDGGPGGARGGGAQGQGRRNDGRGQGGGRRGAGPSGGSRGQGAGGRGDGPRRQKPACEIVVASPEGSVAADVFRADVPPQWREIPPVVFFKSGVFLRAQGAVKQIARDLAYDEAVVYAVWEDPTATYPFEGNEIRPGVTCSLLVRSSDPDGPPWLPLQAVVASGQAEIESGILSPWLDQVACARFRPAFLVSKNRLSVATDTSQPVVGDRTALAETLGWLAAHRDDDGLLARLARVMLVDDGHGLQRYGVSLMHAPDAEKRAAITDILVPLAPEVGALMLALWDMWQSPRALRASRETPETVLAVAREVERALSEDSTLQLPSSLALIVAWMAGLYGVRAERSGRQPARTLFAVARTLRDCGRQLKALAHVDSPLPRFPLDRTENAELLREMSHLPRQESNLERLMRALSISESAWHFSRPRRDHLRPFRIIYPMVRGYPNASRSFMGRFDHVFTGWSFRGSELRDDGVPDGALAGVFITQSPSITSTRAFARAAATPSKTGQLVASGLRSLPDTPALSRLGDYRENGEAEAVASYQEAATHERMTWLRLLQAIGAAEYLIARSEHGETVEGFCLLPPVPPGDAGAGVRSHFMYWRMFCRSIAWKLPDVYQDFVESIAPRVTELPPKLQTELFALVRRWGLHSDANRAVVSGWADWLTDAIGVFFDTDDRTWLDGEWLDMAGAALAVADRPRTIALLERLVGDPDFNVGHVDRLVEGTRAAGWQRELVEQPVFSALHDRLAGMDGVHAVRARVEWTRAAVDRARHSEAVRWLLDPRSYPRVLGSAEFGDWFTKRGSAAVRNPDGAIVELLEVALHHIAPTHLDLVLRALDARTTWPPEQHLAALRDAGRPDAVALRLRMAPTGASDEHASAVAALFDVADGRGLRSAAAALAHFVTTRGEGETAEILRDGLAGSYERYAPFRFALDGFAAALQGWRVAGLGQREPAPRLLEAASKWCAETGDERLAEFVGSSADADARRALTGPLMSALSGETAAAEFALPELPVSDALEPAVAVACEGSRKGGVKALRAAFAGAGATGTIDATVAGALLGALRTGADPDAVCAALAALAARSPEALAREDSQPAGVDTAVAVTDLPEAKAEGPETQPDAAEVQPEATGAEDDSGAGGDSGAEHEAGGDGSTSGADAAPTDDDADRAAPDKGGRRKKQPQPKHAASRTALVRRRRETIAGTLASALRRWAALAPRLLPLGDESLSLLDRISHWGPVQCELRAELFSSLGGLRDDLRTLDDPRRVLTTDFLDGLGLDVDPADFVTLVDGLRRVAFLHDGDPMVVLDRRGLFALLPRTGAEHPLDGHDDEHEDEHEPERSDTPGEAPRRRHVVRPEDMAEATAQTEAPTPPPTEAGHDDPAQETPASAEADRGAHEENPAAGEAGDDSAQGTPASAEAEGGAPAADAAVEGTGDIADGDQPSEAGDTPAGDTPAEEVADEAVNTPPADVAPADAKIAPSDSSAAETADGAEPDAQGTDASAEIRAPGEAAPLAAQTQAGAPHAPATAAHASPFDRIVAGWDADADAEARTIAFGEPGVPLLLRHLAKRNGLSVKVTRRRKRPAIALDWGGR